MPIRHDKRLRCASPVLEACEPRLLLSGAWNVTELDQGWDMGRYTSIAVAEKDTGSEYTNNKVVKGTVFITCYDDTTMFEYSGLTLYSGQVGSIGHKRLMESGNAGKFSSIALDSQNVLHVSYWNETDNQAMYVRSDAVWSSGNAGITVDYSSGQYTSLAVDSADVPHAVYYDAVNGKLKYASAVSKYSWDATDIATVGTVSEAGATNVHRLASLAVDADDHPHVSYYDANDQSLKYIQWTGKVWTDPVTLDGGGANVGVDNTMKLDRQGHPHIAYYDAVNQDLKYVRFDGTKWTTPITLDSAGIVGQYASMDMDGSGYPHISYGYTQYPFDPNSQITNPRLKYAHWDGSAWQISVIDTEDFGAFEYTSCYVDQVGTAYVSYFRDWVNVNGMSFRLATAQDMGAVPNPDLTAEVKLPAGQTWLPGDKVSIPVTVTNIGADTAVGPVTVRLYGSPDNTLEKSGDDSDPNIGTITAAVNLAQDQSRDFVFSLTIPPDAIPGNYYLIAEVEASPAINEVKTANNLDVSDNTLEIIWQAGTFGSRSNFVLSVTDDSGVVTKFSLSGGGYAQIIGGDEFTQLAIQDTTPNSVLTITAPAGAITEIGDIVVNGSLKSLVAKTVVITGSLTVSGTIGTLVLNDVQDDHMIDLNTLKLPVDPKLGLVIALDRVADCSLDTHGIPIKSLTVTEWLGDGTITAPWIGSLTVKGDKKQNIAGDFEVGLKLGPAGAAVAALGNVKIAGNLHDSEWTLSGGNLGAVVIGGEVSWSQISQVGNIKSFKSGRFADSEINAGGEVGGFVVSDWDDSDLRADSLKSLVAGNFNRGRLELAGKAALPGKPVLGAAKVGNITDSADKPDTRGWRIGGDVGAVTVGNATNWYLRSDKAIKSLKAGAVSDSDIKADGLLGSIAAKSWAFGSITADSIGTIATTGDKLGNTGDFIADLFLEGANVLTGKPTLGAVKVAGNIGTNMPDSLTWDINGDVGTVAAKGDIWCLDTCDGEIGNLKSLTAASVCQAWISATGAIGTLQVKEWDTGTIDADSLGTFKVTGDAKAGIAGALWNMEVNLAGQNVPAGKLTLGVMSVADEANSFTLLTGGSVGSLAAGMLVDSEVRLGCNDITGNISDFTGQFTLGSLAIKGLMRNGALWHIQNTEIGAYNIGKVQFGATPLNLSGAIEYHLLGSIVPPLVGGIPSIFTQV